MKKNPKVSIVIPVYNGADYVKEAIDSALAQTYKNIEIIVVNDGSKDEGKTDKIVKSYGTKVKYFKKENGGVSTALNLAIKEMTGDYFSWLSHDDRYYKQKIESQLNYLKDYNDKTILYSDYDLMDEYSTVFTKSIANHKDLMQKKEYSLLRGAINGITLLIPKKAFEECGGFREDLRCTQDYELWLRMMKKNYEFVHQSEILATTRLHANQVGNTSPKMLTEGYDLWVEIIESFTDEEKIKLNNSVYSYYYKNLEFIKTSPYKEVEKYLENKLKEQQKTFEVDVYKAKVTFVIPYIFTKEEINKTIKIIENQKIKNYEILLIDKGYEKNLKNELSKNNFIKIVSKKNDSDLKILEKESTGEYIAIVDSFAEYLNDKTKIQIEEMMKNDAELSYTSYWENGEKKINCYTVNSEIIQKCITDGNIQKTTIMFKKNLLNNIKLELDLKKDTTEDVILYLELLKNSNAIAIDNYLVNIYENKEYNEIKKVKTTIKYIINDSIYSNYELELSTLCNKFYKLFYGEEKNKKNNLKTLKNRLLKLNKILKQKGFVYCLKRLKQKILRK